MVRLLLPNGFQIQLHQKPDRRNSSQGLEVCRQDREEGPGLPHLLLEI